MEGLSRSCAGATLLWIKRAIDQARGLRASIKKGSAEMARAGWASAVANNLCLAFQMPSMSFIPIDSSFFLVMNLSHSALAFILRYLAVMLEQALYFWIVLKISLIAVNFLTGHCCILFVNKYEVRCQSLSQSAFGLHAVSRLYSVLNNFSALMIGGARMDVTIGPAFDVAIAEAEVKAISQVCIRDAREVGSEAGGCSCATRSSIR